MFAKSRIATVLSAFAFAMALVMSPTAALATGGGGSEGGGAGPAYNVKYAYVWYDGGGYGADGELNPVQGWDDASVNYFLRLINQRMPLPIGGTSAAPENMPHETKYRISARQALSNARARSGEPKARVVGAGWSYQRLRGGNACGFVHGNDPYHTFSYLMPREATAAELPAEIGWSDQYKNEGISWRQKVYQQGKADLPGTDYSIVVLAAARNEPLGKGTLEFTKTPGDPNIVTANANYTTVGATYGIYTNAACDQASLLQTFTTEARDGSTNGHATIQLPAGRTYYVKEITPSQGYKLNPEVLSFNIKSGETTPLTSMEEPLASSLFMKKLIEGEGEGVTLGDIKLAGAVVEMKFFSDNVVDDTPDATFHVTSNEYGEFPVQDSRYIEVVAGEAVRDMVGNIVHPLGTYTVQEIKPPAGLMLEGQTDPKDENYKAPIHTFESRHDNNQFILNFDNPILPINFDLFKVDSELGDQVQGDSMLEGTVFSIENASDGAIKWRGKTYQPGDMMADNLTIKYNEEIGRYMVNIDDLPYGTYIIREVEADPTMSENTQEYILKAHS